MELSHLLELSPIVERQTTAKRFVQTPNLELLTEDQSLVFADIMDWYFNDTEHPIFLLKGYAGTGKTFLTSMIMEQLLTREGYSPEIKMTAPTNKAVKVMEDSANYQHTKLDYRTLHSLLCLTEKIDGHGRITFVPDWNRIPALEGVDLVCIDEGSMLPDPLFDGNYGDEKMNGITQFAGIHKFKILIIGDPAQIPPIGRDNSLPFTPEGIDKYKIRVGELTHIVRQSADNPIIQTTMAVRNFLGRANVLPIREDKFDLNNNDGVYYLDGERSDFFYKLLKNNFSSDNFKADANFMKVIAWRNETLRVFNKLIRGLIYGKDVGKLVMGEKLIANKPIFDQDEDGKEIIIFSNNDELEIVGLTVSTVNYKGAELAYYKTKVSSYKEGDRYIKIIHEDGEEDLQIIRDYLKGVALAHRKGSWEAAGAWKDYFAVDKFFADVSYNYAISAHKSQGSTYSNVVVLESDIDANRNITERNRIKYTAFTRAKHKLFIVE